MYWIALQPSPDEDRTAWGWRALQFTPRVAEVDEALLLEVGASERLFGGRRKLLERLIVGWGATPASDNLDGLGDRRLGSRSDPSCQPAPPAAGVRFAQPSLQAPATGHRLGSQSDGRLGSRSDPSPVPDPPPAGVRFAQPSLQAWAGGNTALVALARLRLKRAGHPRPATLDELPLSTLTALQRHLGTLERIGCTTWGELRVLPRAGVSRRFGAEVLQALDCAYGKRPERYDWLELPERFDFNQELPALATSADELMFTGQRLLTLLQLWLQARNLGVLAFELEWTLDLRKLDGKPLPPTEKLEVRTAQPTQDMRHLRRLTSEQLARATISAPANHLRLRTLDTVPWGGTTTSLLPEDNPPGEKLHQLVERLSVRLGEGNVKLARPQQDHRPERMQQWVPARHHLGKALAECGVADVLYPPWVLREPQRLQVRDDKPVYQGALQLLTRARRVEAAWWDVAEREPVLRDYFVARSASAGLLWIFRERLSAEQDRAQWFLHGLYA